MRICILGDTGDGKTLSAVDILYEYYQLGYLVYSNIHLEIPYEKITTINFFETVDNTKKNIVLIDEIGELGKASSSTMFSFTQMLAQSRKSIGENHHLIMTTQTKHQTNPTMRGLVDYLVFPEILVRENEKPVIVQLDWYSKIKRTYPVEFWFTHSTYRYVQKTCEMYDTMEIAKPLQNRSFEKYLKKYKKFIGTRKIKNLYVKLLTETGLNKTENMELARQICYADELYPKLIEKL